MHTSRTERLLYGLALAFGVLPLWVGGQLPVVDLPQHLHLISVLHRLSDVTTLYPEVFEARGKLTPYLGYYHVVSLLNWVLPLPLANKVFLSAYVVGMPLSMGFLLRSLGRPRWPSLLALPFAYGDSFAWGFINYCSALPLAFLGCGLFVRAVADAPRRRWWAALLAGCLMAVLLFHVQAFAFLGVGLPVLLLTTRAPEDGAQGSSSRMGRWLAARRYALAGVLPSVALFGVWVVGRLGEPAEVEAGAPWKAWGPLLSPQNLAFKSFEQNRAELLPLLANMLRDGSDFWAVYAVGAVAAAALVLGLLPGTRGAKVDGAKPGGWLERLRLPALALVALALYFTLPFDIRGYIYYLNTRFVHLAAPLAVACVPVIRGRRRRWLLGAAAACAVVLGVTLGRGFAAFGREASALDEVARLAAPKARVMGLIFDTSSAVVRHPVYLHAAASLARERGGLCNFSFALTPHSPLAYRGEPPPTFPSEWRPDQFRFEQHGGAYDHFLVRGAHPAQVFGSLLEGPLANAGHAGGFWLVRRH